MKDIEDEATRLAGALLVPEPATIEIVRKGISISAAADHFVVSGQMIQWRINMTGARQRVLWAQRSR